MEVYAIFRCLTSSLILSEMRKSHGSKSTRFSRKDSHISLFHGVIYKDCSVQRAFRVLPIIDHSILALARDQSLWKFIADVERRVLKIERRFKCFQLG